MIHHKRLFLIIGGVAIAIVVIGVVFYFGSRDREIEVRRDESGIIIPNQPGVPDTFVPDAVPPLELDDSEEVVDENPAETEMKQISRVFVESWGSYARDNGFENFDDAAFFADVEMRAYLRGLKFEMEGKTDGPDQVVTSALTANIVEQSESGASLEIMTQRTSRTDGVETRFGQRAFIEVVAYQDGWLVSRAAWSDETF